MGVGDQSMENSPSKVLSNFETMAYNEQHSCTVYDNFFAEFGNQFTSIGEGHPQFLIDETAHITLFDKYKVIVDYTSATLRNFLENDFDPIDIPDQENSNTRNPNFDTDVRAQRIIRLKAFVSENEEALCVAESLASDVPFWRVKKYDLPLWKRLFSEGSRQLFSSLLQNPESPPDTKTYKPIVFPVTTVNGQSTTHRLLSLLIALAGERRRFVICPIVVDHNIQNFIPIMHLLQEINWAGFWDPPIDLLITARRGNENMLEDELIEFAGSETAPFIIWNPEDVHLWSTLVPVSFFSGVFPATSHRNCVQYVLDSTADLESAVEAVTTTMWVSGSQGRCSSRLALLFVEQSVEDHVIDLFTKMMSKLIKLDSADFRQTEAPSQYHIPNRIPKSTAQTAKVVHVVKGYSEACLIYNVGTSAPFTIGKELGWKNGLILYLLPFRNTPELIGLSNSFGGVNKVISLFTSNPSLIPQLTTSVQALGGIWINMTPRQQIPPTQHNLGVVLDKMNATSPEPTTAPPAPLASSVKTSATEKPNWKKITEEGEKGLKAWKNLGSDAVYCKVASAFRSAMTQKPEGNDPSVTLEDLLELTRVIGRRANEGPSDELVAHRSLPYGLVGIVFHGPISKRQVFKIILLALAKGNAVVAVSISTSESSTGIHQAYNEWSSYFPDGVLQFQQVPTITDAINGLAQEGKVPLVWFLHAASEKVPPGKQFQLTNADIPKDAFSMLLVDDIETVDSRIESRAIQLEISTPVYFS